MLEEALEASDMASEDGIYANVINVTSADRLFHTYVAASQQGALPISTSSYLLPSDACRRSHSLTVIPSRSPGSGLSSTLL